AISPPLRSPCFIGGRLARFIGSPANTVGGALAMAVARCFMPPMMWHGRFRCSNACHLTCRTVVRDHQHKLGYVSTQPASIAPRGMLSSHRPQGAGDARVHGERGPTTP